MSEYTLGIVGCGSMGEALAMGWHTYAKKTVQVSVCVKHAFQAQKMHENGISTVHSPQELTSCDILVLAIRPEQIIDFLQQNASALSALQTSLVISVAAGVPLADLRKNLAQDIQVVRIMPNTPVAIGQGILGLCHEDTLPEAMHSLLQNLCNSIGTMVKFEESLMNAFTALAGCGPGFHYHIMDSFIEAGVSVGLSREQSTIIATSLMRSCGSVAQMQQIHPVLLREQSTSPRGMTIEGLNYLDTMGTRGHIINAVKIASARGLEMDKES